MSPQAREAVKWICSPESMSEPEAVKAEILRRWGKAVWCEVLGFSLAAMITEMTDRLAKEHT